MSSVVDQIVDDIVKDVTSKLNSVTAYVANKVANDWEEKAKHVMDAYYSTGTAGYYSRTGSLRNTVQRVLEGGGTNYVAGVKFDMARMSHGDMPKFSESAIMDNFMYGQHGNEDYTSPRTGKQTTRSIAFTTPHARIVLDQYYQNYDSKIDQYFEEAFSLFGL